MNSEDRSNVRAFNNEPKEEYKDGEYRCCCKTHVHVSCF